jgi:flavin-dependent dehydrogenase
MRRQNPEIVGEADIIIVGSGPAGCSTALHLERLNPGLAARTLILEKNRHPREKVCGGALTLNAERILSELGIPLNIPYAPVHHVRLVYGEAHIDLPEDGCAKRIIRRREFDNLLFQTVKERGIATEEEVRVVQVIRQPEHLVVVTNRGQYRAQVVVSADGVSGLLRRTPGFGPGRRSRIYEVETPADPTREAVFTEQIMLVDLSYIRQGLKGYYWDFPCYIDGRPFVSRGVADAGRLGNKAFLSEILARRGVDTAGAAYKAWPIRHFDPRERLSQPRMLLVGDAMGTDPLFLEGISQGLASGRLAAEALDEGFRRNDLSFSRYTRQVRESRMGRELVAYVRAARFLYGRQSELLLSLLYESQELRNLIGHSYAGTEDISESVGRILRHLAKHLLHARRRIHSFRAVAALGNRAAHAELAAVAVIDASVGGADA